MKDKLPRPTEEEISQTKKMLVKEYDIVIPKSGLIKLTALIKELGWWLSHKRNPDSPIKVTEKMAVEFKDLLKDVRGIDIPLSESYDEARSLLVITEYKEKERLSKEIRAILVTYMPIHKDKAVEEKTKKLFELQYGTTLTQGQLEQVVQYLTRNLWFEEGLDQSLEKCLDDLLTFSDKQKWGKRTNGINSHDEIRRALDEAMGKLNIPNLGWERFFKEKE